MKNIQTNKSIIKKSATPALEKHNGNFIISRYENGKIASIYDDDIWLLSPDSIIAREIPNIHFNDTPESVKDDLKWISFCIKYSNNTTAKGFISDGILYEHVRILKHIANFIHIESTSFQKFFHSEAYLLKYLQGLDNYSAIKCLKSTVKLLSKIDSDSLGFSIFIDNHKDHINDKLKSTPHNREQHAVIPERIYFEIIHHIKELFSELHTNKNNLSKMTENILRDPAYGARKYYQSTHGYYQGEWLPDFCEVTSKYGLNHLFKKYGIRSRRDFLGFISKIKFYGILLIAIFTGMRKMEILNLKVNSLNKFKSKGKIYYEFRGVTTKQTAHHENTTWITSAEIIKGYELVNSIAQSICKVYKIDNHKKFLFISHKNKDTGRPIYLCGFTKLIQDLERNHICIICKKDIEFLYKIDPFRSWGNNQLYNIGNTWHFTMHQFRRSLAFFAAQSGIVTLPALKRQFKHIRTSMTLYYSQSMNTHTPANTNYVDNLIKPMHLESSIIAYTNNILCNQERLYGTKGKFIENKDLKIKENNNIRVLQKTRKELVNLADRGLFSYKETMLGACTSLNDCNKKISMDIAGCIDCKDAIITKSKLSNTVNRYKKYIVDMEKDSFEVRLSLEILKKLEEYKTRIENRN